MINLKRAKKLVSGPFAEIRSNCQSDLTLLLGAPLNKIMFNVCSAQPWNCNSSFTYI